MTVFLIRSRQFLLNYHNHNEVFKIRLSAAAELIVRWSQIRDGNCRHRKTKKVFQSKANSPLSTVNKFEQVQRGPEVNKLNRYGVAGGMEGPHVIGPV